MSVYRENLPSNFRQPATTTRRRPSSTTTAQQVVLNGLNFQHYMQSRPPLLEADEDIDEGDVHFDSEITIQFEGEIQTLYVGPVAIKDEQLFHENNPDRWSPVPITTTEEKNTMAVADTETATTTTTTTMPTPVQATEVADLTAAVADSGIIDPKDGGGGAVEEEVLITNNEKITKDSHCSETVIVAKSSIEAEKPKEPEKSSEQINERRSSSNPESVDNYKNPSPGSDSGIENGPEETPENTQQSEISQVQTSVCTAANTEEVESAKEKPERRILTRKRSLEPRIAKKKKIKKESKQKKDEQPEKLQKVTEPTDTPEFIIPDEQPPKGIQVIEIEKEIQLENCEIIIPAVEEPTNASEQPQTKEFQVVDTQNCEFILPTSNTTEQVGDDYEVLHEIEIIPSKSDHPVQYEVVHLTENYIIQEVADDKGAKGENTTTTTKVIQCAKCTMSFKTEVWYKKHLINYHGVDLSNIAHFLTNLQHQTDEPIEDEQQAILNDLLNDEVQPTTSETFEDFTPAFDEEDDAMQGVKRESSRKKDRERKLSVTLGEKKKRVELISFDQEEDLNVDALKNPFVVEYLTKETKAQPEKLGHLIKEVQKSNNKENQEQEDEPEETEVTFHDSQITTIKTNGETKYGCKLCGATFTKRFSVPPHIYRVHMRKRDKVCKYCNRGFPQTGDLTRHLRTHTGNKPFKCDFLGCNLAFISSGDLFKHSKRHQAAGVPKPHVCDICSIAFERNYDLMRHKIRHRMDEDPNVAGFKCEICQKRFARKDQYRNHTYRHLGYKPFKCECGKSFADASNFNKHKKTHLGFPQNTALKCDRCGKEFRNKVAISKHVIACIRRQSLK